MKTRLLTAVICIAPLLFASQAAEAWSPKISVDDDTWIQLGFLGQFRFETGQNKAGVNEDHWNYEFYTRRARIMGLGSVHENVRFFFSTDVPNTGGENVANSMVWNDGFVDFQIMPELKIAFGRILVPFSVENQASAAALLGIDYNLGLLKTPTFVDRAFWRDDGFEVRGILFEGLIDYRLGVFRGVRDFEQNPRFEPRTTGMVLVNLQDAQPGWFYNPNSLGSLDVISFGAGFDRVPRSGRNFDDSLALSAFALIEQGIAGGRLNALIGYYNWDGPAWGGGFEGHTLGAQLGFLIPGEVLTGRLQPVVRFQRQDDTRDPEDGGGAGLTLNTVNLGLNYYLKGQAVNFKVDYALNDRLDADGLGADTLRLQAQLLF